MRKCACTSLVAKRVMTRVEAGMGGGRSPKSTTLPERVAQTYYAHGLLCASYPTPVIALATIIALICCYPLMNLPLSSNPTIIWRNGSMPTSTEAAPKFYVQQVVLKTAVIPWSAVLGVGDAFRAPLYESFKLLDVVRNYQDPVSMKTLGHVCLHVESIKRSKQHKVDVLPEYSCLVLSPANFWKQDVQLFSQDSSILSTIFNYQNLQKGKTSVAEMLFGMHLVDTGIKRYPLRSRQRVVQYAVTLFFDEHDEQFIGGLRNKLAHLYPLHKARNVSADDHEPAEETVLIHYPGEISYYEHIPIVITYLLLFFYYYFSVRKIELVSSRVGMAVTVLITVLSSLFMTLGVCFFFGLTLSVHNRQVFPYLVILVGLENVLVLTKSVVSTPTHLDIKIRVAQGLSKEGWSITKNLMIEITILTIGLFTFVPAIQEICIFSIVGLIADFFLQMLFFSTILGIDTRKLENTEKNMRNNFRNTLYQTHTYEKTCTTSAGVGLHRSKSHPRLNTIPANIVAGGQAKSKIPKRLRLVNIWARTRFFQRAFMILMVVWIGMILYNSGIAEQYFSELKDATRSAANRTAPSASATNDDKQTYNLLPILNGNEKYMVNFVTEKSMLNYHNNSDDINRLKHTEYKPWLSLSTQHWSAILRKYNISTSGGYVTILPSIQISHIVAPEQAVLLRNPDEKYGKFEWPGLALALDPIDFSDGAIGGIPTHYPQNDRPFYPTSPMEIFLTAILCLISVIVLAYTVFVLYKCICSRNYAEWRASWASDRSDNESDVPVLLEAVPVVMDGHKQEIECLASDGRSIASTCLGGNLKIWDTVTGDLVASIDRSSVGFQGSMHSQDEEDILSDYESGSPPSRDEDVVAFLRRKINTKFINLRLQDVDTSKDFHFGDEYKQIANANASHLRNRSVGAARSTDCNRDECVHNEEFARGSTIDILNARADYVLAHRPQQRKDSHNNCGSNNSGSGAMEPSQPQCAKVPSIWCMDFVDNLVVVGCADGRLEFWEGTTSKFKCMCEDTTGSGVTSVKIVGSRVVAARIYGTLDFFQLQSYNQGRPIDWNFTCAYRRTHVRTGSAGSISDFAHSAQADGGKEDLRCVKVLTTKAHQQPIACLDCEGGRVLTGSQDHTLKVFRVEDGSHLYTLHGHNGPISCLFIDRISPATSGSGSQDGMLCVWDLLTGACMYSIQAHDGCITSLTYSASYVISLGADERICVWERFQGHLLNTLHVNGTFTCQVLMLTPHLVITARSAGLALWDVRRGENVKSIVFGRSPYVFVKQLVVLRDAVLCDFGTQLRIVRFPLITHKSD